MTGGPKAAGPGWQMFALSFTGLFLEMMVIRWVPSVVHLVAYYANLMLLSSFLGLGAGAMAARRRWNLLPWFPVFLCADILMLAHDHNAVLGTSASEAHFFALPPGMFNALVLVRIFAVNALVFAPLGQGMGRIFDGLPRLSAYAWDLAGSLAGVLAFGVFSLRLFSPAAGMACVMVLYLAVSGWRRGLVSLPFFAIALAAVGRSADPNAIWSPYYYVTVNDSAAPGVSVAAPAPNLLTMRDPPAYIVRVNQFGYHVDATIDLARYTPGTELATRVSGLRGQYLVPYSIGKGRDRILVLGAGGGCDVEAALDQGARHVDAVEIDPVIISIARRFNSGQPYADPRVSVHIDDARSYLAKARPGYDLVVFGYLDSQALFSSMNNVRLDGYVYTVESLRSAFNLLNENGVLSISFALGKPWLGVKLYDLLGKATGREPAAYFDPDGIGIILCVPKSPSTPLPEKVAWFRHAGYGPHPAIDLPTDDWPFLYLIRRTIPSDYLVAIGCLLAFSVATILFLRRGAAGREDLHFGLMGMGFLLLETRNISDCTLFFGATWLVTLVVVAGILLMVLGANFAAERIPRSSPWMYLPLAAVLVLLLVVPRESILPLSLGGRLLWSLLVVPLPAFFAGVIFSTTFREAADGSAVFGANLIGAMVGGFCEYLAMAVGGHRLAVLILCAYLGSYLVLRSARKWSPA